MASLHQPVDEASDAARWWRAYLLAENDQAEELRQLTNAGDDHARRQLASWLSDRGRTEEAIEMIRPLADAGDDVAELWLTRWLADGDHAGELRQRAATGSYHAPRELARLLAEHDRYHELHERATSGGDYYALRALAAWLTQHDRHQELRDLIAAEPERRLLILEAAGETGDAGINALRVLADFGDKRGRVWLARRLAREGQLDELRERAARGDDYARQALAEALGQA
jgi:hypothetical protein